MFMACCGKALPLPFYVANAELNVTVNEIIVPIQKVLNSIG
jgi:hypothetical protein